MHQAVQRLAQLGVADELAQLGALAFLSPTAYLGRSRHLPRPPPAPEPTPAEKRQTRLSLALQHLCATFEELAHEQHADDTRRAEIASSREQVQALQIELDKIRTDDLQIDPSVVLTQEEFEVIDAKRKRVHEIEQHARGVQERD